MAGNTPAQEPRPDPVAARSFWARAVSASAAGRLSEARTAALEAARVFPSHPKYILGLASLSAALHDTAGAARWLERYAAFGLSTRIDDDDDFRPLLGAAVIARAAAQLDRNRRPLVRSKPVYRVGPADFFPEGIACRAETRICYLGSVRFAKIVRVDRAGRSSDLVAAGVSGLAAPLGLALSADGATLWASSVPLPYTVGDDASAVRYPAVLAFATSTGELLRRCVPPADSIPASPGDLLVARNGDVFVSDSRRGIIYRVPPAGDTLEVFASSPLLRSPQGIAESADGALLYVADYSSGLVAVSRADRTVRLMGLPAWATTVGVDGMVRSGDALIGIQNGVTPARVIRMRLAGPDTIGSVTVLDRNLPTADQPTSGTLMNDEFWYIADSQWDDYTDAGALRPGVRLRPPVVLRLRPQ